ncbi:MAG: flotillin [Rhodospirillaceae bacterium TMED167]|nr:flotillin [Rhodospirillaceae bacterium]OUW26940.1 MAG: flotillin [Rhodospirillaceae bacterium TMED167]
MATVIIWIIIALVVIVVALAIFAKFYQRATQEISLVKTGVGGRKVVVDGGAIAIPWFHEVSKVNMQTLRLEVQRAGESALITNDKLRVDVGAEFYVSVHPTAESIALAAQTLGNRTFNPDALRELIEGKLVDALRAVAARVTMDELHENRGDFVAKVQQGLVESLARNGLALDTVSLTALDQTPFTSLDENNAFNAVGMRKLAEVIAKSKKERAEIDSDADVSVRRAAMEASKRKLEIELEEQQAEIAQVQQIESLKARQLAEVAKEKAASEGEAAQARIEMEQDIRAADIAREQKVREAEITHERDVALANQARDISLSKKSQEQSKAKAAADLAKAEGVKAAEAISTARAVADAERRRSVAVIAAQQEGQVRGQQLRMSAEAEKDAAVDRADARRAQAQAQADASEVLAAAKRQEMIAEADGQEALAKASNSYTESAIALKIDMARIEALPKVVSEMVRPAEKIDSIKIHHVTGLGRISGTGTANEGHVVSEKSAINEAVDSVLDMAVQVPALKKIGEELGISVEDGIASMADDLAKKSSK